MDFRFSTNNPRAISGRRSSAEIILGTYRVDKTCSWTKTRGRVASTHHIRINKYTTIFIQLRSFNFNFLPHSHHGMRLRSIPFDNCSPRHASPSPLNEKKTRRAFQGLFARSLGVWKAREKNMPSENIPTHTSVANPTTYTSVTERPLN